MRPRRRTSPVRKAPSSASVAAGQPKTCNPIIFGDPYNMRRTTATPRRQRLDGPSAGSKPLGDGQLPEMGLGRTSNRRAGRVIQSSRWRARKW